METANTIDQKEKKRLARNAAKRAWNAANPDKVKAYRDKYNKAHVEQIRERNRKNNEKRFAKYLAQQKAIHDAWEASPTPNPSWLTKPPLVFK